MMALRSARFHGTLSTWNDDRGFGFISPANPVDPAPNGRTAQGKQTFVHIKAFPASLDRRPQVGDTLSFELGRSPDGKLQATFVQVAGATTTGRRHPRSNRRPRAVTFLPIPLFVAGYLAISATWPLPIWVAALYLAASILTYLAYAADKAAATAGRWRVSESTLLLLGLIGGWPGAIVAQQMLRHKTKKASFRSAFWGTVLANVGVLLAFGTPIVTRLTNII